MLFVVNAVYFAVAILFILGLKAMFCIVLYCWRKAVLEFWKLIHL